jgi:hypothetical protein
LHVLTRRALRRRAAEVGLAPAEACPPAGRGFLLTGVLVAIGVLGVIATWHVIRLPLHGRAHDASPVLQACTAVFGGAALLYAYWLLVAGGRYGATGVHAFAIAFAASALVLGATGMALLRWEEQREVARFDKANYDYLEEMEVSGLRFLRDQAAEELRRASPAPRAATSPA